MKSSELPQTGFYWYGAARGTAWEVVHFEARDTHTPITITGRDTPYGIQALAGDFVGPLEPPETKREGCGARLAEGQWWGFCGETDMGQTLPALCTECGGEYKRAET